MSELIKPIDESQFQAEVLAADRPVVADLGAPWCYWCRILDPVLEHLAGEYADRLKFVKIDTDESPALSRSFSISTVPTLLFFHRGRLLGRETEAIKPPEVRALLERWLQAAAAA
ncbi:MAG: thioredoxin family protein [Nevskia sp.]|nr:thioredoxin family protein [Nevskia sp.]